MAVQNSVPVNSTEGFAKHTAPSMTQATGDSTMESNSAVPDSGHDSVSEDVRPFTYRAPVGEASDQEAAHPNRRRSDASRKETGI